ncbi:hypothetical protein [Enterococcus mediterraneensis]|uniref:hypothetical protein n=1 Tax=Enterococcus mediterraneensis TaxID=2364791 RepID=UPI000F05F4C8|nr:hypothetical protein [Enterococcus mediterraneensis]
MDRIKKAWEKIKQRASNIWDAFADWAYDNQKRALITVISFLLFSLLFSGVLIVSQRHIRQSEYENLIFSTLPPEKILPLDYHKQDQTIEKTRAVSVMFSKPKGADYRRVLQLLDDPDKRQELNRNVFYYPIVYDTKAIQSRYNIDSDEVTFIFFEKGKEKNRFVVSDLENFQEEFIPELNRLPMWSIHEIENN